MKITKEQLKKIIKEELEAVMETEKMSPDDPDYEAVAEAVFDVIKKLPGGMAHTKMMMSMPGMNLEGNIYPIAEQAAEARGVPQHAEYVFEKVMAKLR